MNFTLYKRFGIFIFSARSEGPYLSPSPGTDIFRGDGGLRNLSPIHSFGLFYCKRRCRLTPAFCVSHHLSVHKRIVFWSVVQSG